MKISESTGPDTLEARAVRAMDRARQETGYRARLREDRVAGARAILVELNREGSWTVHDVVTACPPLRFPSPPVTRATQEGIDRHRAFEELFKERP